MNSNVSKTKLVSFISIVIAIIILGHYWNIHNGYKNEVSSRSQSSDEKLSEGSDKTRNYIVTDNVEFKMETKQTEKILTKCGDTEEDIRRSSLEQIKPLLPKVPQSHKIKKGIEPLCREDTRPIPDNRLTDEESKRQQSCINNFKTDHAKGSGQFWSGDTQFIRHKHHKYLNSESAVLDIGGNKGEDAEAIIKDYNPGVYVILEPIKTLYKALITMFKKNPNVVLYDFGLGKKNDKFFVNVVGHGGDATSVFIENNKKDSCLLRVYNTTEFLIRLGVSCFDVDLITINCEGCEYDILETLLSTNITQRFRHIQFATHPTLKHLKQPAERYCEIQEKLSRTHVISYQYKFCWESWTRKDIATK